jgi:hypothetical protein
MPNWVHHTLKVVAGDPKVFFDFLRSEKSLVDFNKFSPMPKHIHESKKEVEWEGITVPEWYAWAHDNWGTKWNACDAQFSPNDPEHVLCFETAWSAPEPIFEALAERFPDHEILIESVEPLGNWYYTYILKGGDMTWTEHTCECSDPEE